MDLSYLTNSASARISAAVAVTSFVLFFIIAALALLLVVTKIIYILINSYKNKMRNKALPLLEQYFSTSGGGVLKKLRQFRGFSSHILQKTIIVWSFGKTSQEQIAHADLYETLGFVSRDIRKSRHFFWWHRAEAARCLGQLRITRAKKRLLALLNDKVIEVKLLAAWALGRIGDPDIIVPCMEALVNTSRMAGLRLSSTVFELGEKSIPVLINTLDHENASVRLLAVHLLGELKATTALDKIILKTVGDEDKEVRLAAYKALGSLEKAEAFDCLLTGLDDPLWEVRTQAAKALGRIKLPRAIEPLVKALDDRKWWVRRNAGEALTKLGTKGKEALQNVLTRPNTSEETKNMARQWLEEMS